MKKQTNIIAIIIIFCCFLSFSTKAETVDRIVAKVGSYVITLSDFDLEKKERKAYLIQKLGQNKGLAQYNKIQNKLLDELILDKILEKEIQDNNISVSDEQVEQTYKHHLITNKISEKTFLDSLIKSGLNLTSYKKRLRFDLEKQAYAQQKIAPTLSVSDYDLQQEYNNNIKDYQMYNKVRFIEVFLTQDKFKDETQMKTMAKNIQQKLKQGVSVSALIKKHSSGAFAQKGGDSGLVDASSLRPEIQNILGTLKKGETSGFLTFPGGVILFKLLDKKDPAPIPFNKVVGEVRMQYYEKLLNKELKKHILSIKDKTYVEKKL